MEQPLVAALVRTETGKGPARRMRENKQVPAVFYGPKSAPVMLAVEAAELDRLLKRRFAENVIMDLQITSDQGVQTSKAMLKEVQVDPVKNTYLHADFYEIFMDKEITVNIPLRFVNTPIGAARGGLLQHVRRELTVSCLPSAMVESLEVDVSQLDIGGSLHIRDLKWPEGIRPMEEGSLTVTLVAAPSVAAPGEAQQEEGEEEAGTAEAPQGPKA
jgi:large subunit ribosomal protein L25